MLAGDPAAGVVAAPVVVMDLAGFGSHLVAVDAGVTGTTADQSPKQPGLLVQITRAPLGVIPADSLGCLEDGVVDDGRTRDRDPLFTRPSPLGGGAAPTIERRGRHTLGLIEVDATDVSLVTKHPAHRRMPPFGLPGGSGNLLRVEVTHDLADGVPAVDVLVVDASHHRRFGLEHLEAGRTGCVAWHAPITVGSLPGHHLPGPSPKQPSPPVALADLRPFILGNDALHLGEQSQLRIVVKSRRVAEQDAHPELGQLVEDQDLIGVGPRQAIR